MTSQRKQKGAKKGRMGRENAWVTEGLITNIERLLAIWNRGGIAVLFFDVGDARDLQWLRDLGFDEAGGRVQLRRLTRQQVTRIVKAIGSAYEDDAPIATWLQRKNLARVIVFVRDGTYCLNFDPDTGVSSEPTITSTRIFG
jgi:hypothetical protein